MSNYARYNSSQRRFERTPVEGLCRIFSSVVPGSMTAKIGNVSKGGAFLQTKWTPAVGETITCRILDRLGTEMFSTNAKVA